MNSTTSSVLIVGHPAPERMDIGAAMAPDFSAARQIAEQSPPAVIVFGHGKQNEFSGFCRFLNERVPSALWILSGEGFKPNQLIELANSGRLFDLVEGFDDPALLTKLQGALEAGGQRIQQLKLTELFSDQSQALKRLSVELETRVDRRHKSLRKSQRTLDSTKIRLEAFHRALIGVHRATSVLQMEHTLNETLGSVVPGIQVHVRFTNQSALARSTPTIGPALVIEIPFQYEDLNGEVVFSSAGGRKFTSVESDFLFEVTEALALALSRLHKFELAETVKSQWQATFDSIPHPLCLTTSDYEIVKLNKAFQLECREKSFRDLIGRNCFEVFFKPGFHVPESHTFRATREGREGIDHFEVTHQKMNLHDQSLQLILLRPVTEEVRFERRIFESSKLAELGTIGSSIAHELNNPLGGMLSFLQLILMDIKPDHIRYADIKSMEQGTLRCRDIVQNLLSFARKQDLGDFKLVNVQDVLDKAVKLIELQSKSKGISITSKIGGHAAEAAPSGRLTSRPSGGTCGDALPVLASENALSQAVCNLLQNSIDAIGDRMTAEPLYPGRITLELNHDESNVYLRISDNGTGIAPDVQTRIFNPLFTTRDPGLFTGMGLTTAFTIISEHHGSLEILSQSGSGTTAIVTLPIARTRG